MPYITRPASTTRLPKPVTQPYEEHRVATRTARANDTKSERRTATLVIAHRDERAWRLTRDGHEVAHVAFLDQIEAAIGAGLIETTTDVTTDATTGATPKASAAGVRVDPAFLSAELAEEIRAARTENEAVTLDLDAARRRWRLLARALHTLGMGPTQMTRVLGVSRAAVEKLLRRANEDPADAVPTATGLDLLADVEDARAQVEAATARQQVFTPRWQRLAANLQTAGLTNRDVAHLMGISRQRVAQLAPRPDQGS